MNTKERMETLINNNEDAQAALAELGFVRAETAEQEALAKGIEQGRAEAAKEHKERTVKVLQVCKLGEVGLDQALSMVEQGMEEKAAMETVQKLKAEKSRKTTTNSTTHTFTGDGKHPLVDACEKMGK